MLLTVPSGPGKVAAKLFFSISGILQIILDVAAIAYYQVTSIVEEFGYVVK